MTNFKISSKIIIRKKIQTFKNFTLMIQFSETEEYVIHKNSSPSNYLKLYVAIAYVFL